MSPEREIITEAVTNPGKINGMLAFLSTGALSLWGLMTYRVFKLPENYVSKADFIEAMKVIREDIREDFGIVRKSVEKVECSVTKVHGRIDSMYKEMPKRKDD